VPLLATNIISNGNTTTLTSSMYSIEDQKHIVRRIIPSIELAKGLVRCTICSIEPENIYFVVRCVLLSWSND